MHRRNLAPKSKAQHTTFPPFSHVEISSSVQKQFQAELTNTESLFITWSEFKSSGKELTDLSSSVDMSGVMTDSHRTHDLSMIQLAYLPRVPRNVRAYQGIRGERDGLHLSIPTDMKRISRLSRGRVTGE